MNIRTFHHGYLTGHTAVVLEETDAKVINGYKRFKVAGKCPISLHHVLGLIAPCGWASSLTGHIAEILEETPAMVCGASQCSKHLIITRNSLDNRTMIAM